MRGGFIALRSSGGGVAVRGHDSSSHWPDFSLGLCGEGDAPPCRDTTPSLSRLLAPCLLDSPLMLAGIQAVMAGWRWAKGPRL